MESRLQSSDRWQTRHECCTGSQLWGLAASGASRVDSAQGASHWLYRANFDNSEHSARSGPSVRCNVGFGLGLSAPRRSFGDARRVLATSRRRHAIAALLIGSRRWRLGRYRA